MRYLMFAFALAFFGAFATWCAVGPPKLKREPMPVYQQNRDLNENPERDDEDQLDALSAAMNWLARWILSWFEVCLVAEPDVDRLLWEETGVPFPEGMKFYRLPRMSQHLSIVNDTHINVPTLAGNAEVHRKPIWAAPGGLAWSPRSEWRNATAVYLPGDVSVYRTMTQVKNSAGFMQDNTVIRWRFPEGTLFADLLIRKQGEREWPFELRLREKKGGEWLGTVYRPPVPADAVAVRWRTPRLDEHIGPKEFEAMELRSFPQGKFTATRQALVGSEFLPKHYSGHVTNCNDCHSRAGESGNYSGLNAPGSDGVISWHPFKEDGNWNREWPLKIELQFVGRDVDHFGRRQPGLR